LILVVTVILLSRLLLYDLQKENSYQKEMRRSTLDVCMRRKGICL
jgi:hypothetical protein